MLPLCSLLCFLQGRTLEVLTSHTGLPPLPLLEPLGAVLFRAVFSPDLAYLEWVGAPLESSLPLQWLFCFRSSDFRKMQPLGTLGHHRYGATGHLVAPGCSLDNQFLGTVDCHC